MLGRWIARVNKILVAGLALLLNPEPTTTEEHIETLNAEELALLQEGDFVFRLGYGMVSFFLESQTGASGVSHVGILVKDSLDFNVIHSISGSMAESDGVQKIFLNDFLFEAKPHSFVATRLKNSNGELIANEARNLLAKRVPFDMSFDIKDTSKLFCSEMINFILQKTHNTEVFNQEATQFPFTGFFDTSKFEILVDRRE